MVCFFLFIFRKQVKLCNTESCEDDTVKLHYQILKLICGDIQKGLILTEVETILLDCITGNRASRICSSFSASLHFFGLSATVRR